MILEPLLPAWVIVGAALAAVAAVITVYRRPDAAAVLRVGTLAVLVLMLANPVIQHEVPQRRRSAVTIVVDSSGSMATADAAEGATRYASALNAASALRARLAPSHDVNVLGLAGGTLLPATPPSPAGDTGFAPLEELATANPKPTAVVLLSDGADWSGAQPEIALARARVPVHAFAVGSPRTANNVALRLSTASATVFPGQELGLIAELTATPDLRGGTVRLVVEALADDGRASPIADQRVELAAWSKIELRTTVGEARGGRLWRARIDRLPAEITYDDNEAWAAAQVVEREVKVLVLEGRPGWDTTFAVRAWRRDRQLQVSTTVSLGRTAWRAGSSGDKTSEHKARLFAGVDVLVLGSRVAPLLGADGAAELAGFVDRGGGLLLIGPGPRDVPAVDLLDPCTWMPGEVQAELTADSITIPGLLPAGARAPVTAGLVSELKPQSRLIAGTRERPLVALRRHGSGWVCSANLIGLWRWQLAPGDGGREPAERFWRQLMRQVAEAPQGRLRPERTAVGAGEDLVVWVQPDSGDQPLIVTDPAGKRREAVPVRDRVQLRADSPGLWRFQRGADRVTMVVTRQAREALEIGRDDARLRRLAERTGGTWGDIADAERLAARLAGSVIDAGRTQVSTPLITEPWWFLAAFLLLASEWWWRRRRHGMV